MKFIFVLLFLTPVSLAAPFFGELFNSATGLAKGLTSALSVTDMLGLYPYLGDLASSVETLGVVFQQLCKSPGAVEAAMDAKLLADITDSLVSMTSSVPNVITRSGELNIPKIRELNSEIGRTTAAINLFSANIKKVLSTSVNPPSDVNTLVNGVIRFTNAANDLAKEISAVGGLPATVFGAAGRLVGLNKGFGSAASGLQCISKLNIPLLASAKHRNVMANAVAELLAIKKAFDDLKSMKFIFVLLFLTPVCLAGLAVPLLSTATDLLKGVTVTISDILGLFPCLGDLATELETLGVDLKQICKFPHAAAALDGKIINDLADSVTSVASCVPGTLSPSGEINIPQTQELNAKIVELTAALSRFSVHIEDRLSKSDNPPGDIDCLRNSLLNFESRAATLAKSISGVKGKGLPATLFGVASRLMGVNKGLGSIGSGFQCIGNLNIPLLASAEDRNVVNVAAARIFGIKKAFDEL
ncbi:hypothetical protein Bhyg_06382 [Pseudolycoriella hygida]|uniref:Uncharacterized protein n=1 Tax=Pseudolycoriella hygida TaxID=35572 RepID=A0A9Q0S2C9_9DIPT|nr:hypothetical protein Bhyg_06382 [Pseudolycoriella hygida]